jgi:hypothetical protein
MAALGCTPAAIATELGADLATIEAIIRDSGYTPPLLPAGHVRLSIPLSAKVRTRIDAEARRRGSILPDLAGAVLSVVARDGLWDKVLE